MDNPSFKQLFNGKDLTGWEMVGDGKFLVENGLLKTVGGMGLLWYPQEKFGNCILKVSYMVSREEDNSGIFVRIADRPNNPWYAVHYGHEIQIMATEDETHKTGCVYSMSKALANPQKKPGQWNMMDIKMEADKIDVAINNTLVTKFDPKGKLPPREYDYEPDRDPRPEIGYIGLQNHDDKSTVFFKEVSIQPLNKNKITIRET